MEHIIDINDKALSFLEDKLFPSIYKAETVLFLGAGASVTNKKFLGQDIIDYYEDKLGISLQTKDLVEFVDVISSLPNFDRNEFDSYILNLLKTLKVSEVHNSIASIKWREIITTNLDTLIEKAYDNLLIERKITTKVKIIRSRSEYSGYNENNEIKYVKLNGCISDKSKYPFVFSTKDFENSKKYYRQVFAALENHSPAINLLSIGFSFSDGLSSYLLKKFDSHSYRNRRWLFSIDPFVNVHKLPFYTANNICIIKLSPSEFFDHYNRWLEHKAHSVVKRKSLTYTSSENRHLSIPLRLKLSLGDSLVQLSDTNSINSVIQKEYYKGNRPTYDVIRKNYDVIKSVEVDGITNKLRDILYKRDEKIIPIVFLEGHFGAGKSTFTYRLIYNILHVIESTIAFEILDPDKVSETDLIELFTISQTKNIILLCNELEVDSQFKEIMSLRNRLSLEQSSEFNLLFVSSIRENILTRILRKSSYKNLHKIPLNLNFDRSEGVDFIEKLSNVGLVKYRDNKQREQLVNRVIKDYRGEAFISLLGLINSNENHLDIILEDAYLQLSEKGKEAVIYTSLLYQYKLLMPASILMKAVSKDWDSFIRDIMEDDCKGILIQEVVSSNGSDPDLYFRTKHSLLSERLINTVFRNEDKLYEKIKKLILSINNTYYNAKLVIDFLKALKIHNKINQDKINKLFDILAKEFEGNDHFNLHFAINIQNNRNDEKSLKLALERLSLSFDNFDRRNHRIIHRRAVLHFELAKIYFDKDKQSDYEYHLNESRELFEIKMFIDPCSSYSYCDYIKFELWCIKKRIYGGDDLLRQHIFIQDLFDLAENSVHENLDKVHQLKSEYLRIFKGKGIGIGKKTLTEFFDELYEVESTRPYSLVLRYNFLMDEGKILEAESLIPEMEYYKFNNAIAKLLFKFYGRNLHIHQNIVNFFAIVKHHTSLKTKEKLRYHFYSFIAEAYNRSFKNTHEHLLEIKSQFNYLNPSISEYWLDSSSGEKQVFEAILMRNQKGKFQAKVIELQQQFHIKINNPNLKLIEKRKYNVYLTFNLRGIRAELLELL